jgi:hypothetical protein
MGQQLRRQGNPSLEEIDFKAHERANSFCRIQQLDGLTQQSNLPRVDPVPQSFDRRINSLELIGLGTLSEEHAQRSLP